MAVTLSKVMQRAWRELGWAIDIQATGGSVTTIVDSNTIYTTTDEPNGGYAVIVHDAGNANAAPEGEYGLIIGFNAGTKTFTIGTTLSAAAASGDAVLITSTKVPLPQMLQAVNDGLTNLGTISLVDTTLSTVNQQREYSLPVGLKIKRIIDVLIQTKTGDADDNRFQSILDNIRFFPAAPGTVGIIETMADYPQSRTLKIVYEGVHPYLSAFNSTVSETIQEELVIAATIDKVLTWYVSKHADSVLGTFVLQRWNDAKQMLQQQKMDKPIFRTKPKTKFFSAQGTFNSPYNGSNNNHWPGPS